MKLRSVVHAVALAVLVGTGSAQAAEFSSFGGSYEGLTSGPGVIFSGGPFKEVFEFVADASEIVSFESHMGVLPSLAARSRANAAESRPAAAQEPDSYAYMLAGLGMLGMMVYRRTSHF